MPEDDNRAAIKADNARRADIALKGIRGKRLTHRRTNEAAHALAEGETLQMVAKAREIPVYLAPPRAGSTPDFAGRSPVSDVHVANDPDWSDAGLELPNHNGRLYQAMIDTGTDSTALDQTIAREINAPTVMTGIAHGWVGTDNAVDIVQVQIVIPSINIVFGAAAAVRDFRGDGQTWDIILGRSFLQHCQLTVDGPRAAYSLAWVQ